MVELKELRDLLQKEDDNVKYRSLRNLKRIQDEVDEIISSNKSKMSVNDAAWERIKMNHRKQYGNEGESDLYRQSELDIMGDMLWAMRRSWIIILVGALLL